MDRKDTIRQIDSDKELHDEILERVAHGADAVTDVVERAMTVDGPARREWAAAATSLTVDTVRDAMAHPFEHGGPPLAEAIVLRVGRPVLFVRDDDVELDADDLDTWRNRLEQHRAGIRAAIRSVGRVELDGHPRLTWAGTAWLVTDDVLVTNRHVAEIFAHHSDGRWSFRPAMSGEMAARVDFRAEHGGTVAAQRHVTEVLHIEPATGPDLAFLRVDHLGGSGEAPREPLEIGGAPPPEGRFVTVIGYPAKDSRTDDPADMDRIFRSTYDVKRLAPGTVTAVGDALGLTTHDCTTLGGNSGSVVLDLELGTAAGLHFAGREGVSNYAVPAPVVAERLADLLGTSGGRSRSRGGSAGSDADRTGSDAARNGAGRSGGGRSTTGRRGGTDTGRDRVRADGGDATAGRRLAERGGYHPDFLGVAVEHPTLGALRAELAAVEGRDDGLLHYTNFSLRMHRSRRLAMYTVVNIDGTRARNVRRSRDRWVFDPRLDPDLQLGNELYRSNTLDRGHLVRRLDPAWGDRLEDAEVAVEDTFHYTNCSPQHEVLNQRLWLGLEDHLLGNAANHQLRISVFSGPVFREDDRVYRGHQIPEDFWKVVAMVDAERDRLSVTAYLLSQRDLLHDLEFTFGPYLTYQVPVREISAQTRLGFGHLERHDPLAETEQAGVAGPLTSFDQIRL